MLGLSGFPEWGITMHAHRKSLSAAIYAALSNFVKTTCLRSLSTAVRAASTIGSVLQSCVLVAISTIAYRVMPIVAALTTDNIVAAWELFGFILSHPTRKRVFAPLFNDFKADVRETKQKRFRSKWAKSWIVFCFIWRFAWMVLRCIRVGVQDRGWKFVVAIAIPVCVGIRWFLGRS